MKMKHKRKNVPNDTTTTMLVSYGAPAGYPGIELQG
jgi:hypothetical protein